MTHEELLTALSSRLEWGEDQTNVFIDALLSVMSNELKTNNQVVIEDFGTLTTEVQPEYILVDTDAKERFIMPPSVEVLFDQHAKAEQSDLSESIQFEADDILYQELNIAFSPFEPMPLSEDAEFPGVPEVILEEQVLLEEQVSLEEPEESPAEESPQPIPVVEHEVVSAEQLPPRRSSRHEIHSKRRKPSVWVPIAGGIVIVMASLFFFAGERKK